MPVRFETDRLIVRDFTMGDAADAFEIYRHYEVQRWLHREPVPSLEAMEAQLAELIGRDYGKGYGVWAVESRESGTVIGTSLFKALLNDSRIENGWHLNPAYWGQGYATEFARGALWYGFQSLGLDEILSILLPENLRSRKVAERCGMRHIERTNRYHGLELDLFRIGRDEWAD